MTIPKDTFVRGDAEQFGPFLKARINKKLRIETKKKKMKAEKAAAEAKQGDKLQETKGKRRKQKRTRRSAKAKPDRQPRIPLSSPYTRACYTSSIYATANGSAPRPPLANEL